MVSTNIACQCGGTGRHSSLKNCRAIAHEGSTPSIGTNYSIFSLKGKTTVMNLRKFFLLTIRVRDFNLVAQRPELLAQLRKLTLHSYSGLNLELNQILKNLVTRPVSCKVVLAYRWRELVGWGLLSNEDSNIYYF